MPVFVDNFQKIASIFKCERSSSLSLLSCLREQEAEHIVLNSKVGETSWPQNFVMAHLQSFSSASDQSSLMVRSKVDFSYFLSKYSLNVEAISHISSFWKFGSVTAPVRLWASSEHPYVVRSEQPRFRSSLHSSTPWPSQACTLYSCAKRNLSYSGCRYLNSLKPFFVF